MFNNFNNKFHGLGLQRITVLRVCRRLLLLLTLTALSTAGAATSESEQFSPAARPELSQQLSQPYATATETLSFSTIPSVSASEAGEALAKRYFKEPLPLGVDGGILMTDWRELAIGAPRLPNSSGYMAWRWAPAEGTFARILQLQGYEIEAAADAGDGTFVLVRPERNRNPPWPISAPNYVWQYRNPLSVVWVCDGHALSVPLLAQRLRPRLLALDDHSVLIIGGNVIDELGRDKHEPSTDVERVTLVDGKLIVEKLPGMPGEPRWSFALTQLADGKVMVLGGTEERFIGCYSSSQCSADTYVLDLHTRNWNKGPAMLGARADSDATLMPDGSVLVTGGWTDDMHWGVGPARTTERWDPAVNRFTAAEPMPSGTAMHRAIWFDPKNHRELLVAGGTNAAVQAFDATTGRWRVVGVFHDGIERGRAISTTFMRDGVPYMWRVRDDLNMWNNEAWSLIPLRLASTAKDKYQIDAASGIALYRARSTFVPAAGKQPALILGGNIASGSSSAVVDAVATDRHIWSLPSFTHSRADAQGFRLPDGSVLIIGGTAEKQKNRSEIDRTLMTAELLPAGANPINGKWLDISDEIDVFTALGQRPDGRLLSKDGEGVISELTIHMADGRPTFERHTVATLTTDRFFVIDHYIKGLTGDRILLCGGALPSQRLAILTLQSMNDAEPDSYADIEPNRPTRSCDVYDPSTHEWRRTAEPAGDRVGSLAIFDDGRMVTIQAPDASEVAARTADADANFNPDDLFSIDISDTDGNHWHALSAIERPLVRKMEAKLMVLQGELFIEGVHVTYQSQHEMRGNAMLQWFDSSAGRWHTLWEAGSNESNWRDNLGRIIVRTLANGKTVVLPVGGR
jgi:hypothetical protein